MRGKRSWRAVGSLVVRASNSRPEGLGSMLDVTKYPPSAHGFTCRNCGGGDRGRVAIYRTFGEVSVSLNRTVTCMVLKANDRRTSCPCHDEFRGPRSDYVRQEIGITQECGCVEFNGPDGRQGCVLTRTVESNQGGRFDSTESVADSFPSDAGSSESVQEFAARINKLGTQIFQSSNSAQNMQVRNADDQSLQSRFISGLRNDIRRFVLARDPNNLEESINMALIEEQNDKLNQIANDERTDFRKLNEITLTQDFVISTLDDILHEISGSNYFSALDMKSAFNQIPLHFADRHKTASSTPDGDKYEFNRLCFGLKNSPKAFQSIAQEVLGDLLHNKALVYIDDIISFTKTIDEHFELLGFLSNKNPSSKILRWKLALEEFNYDIHYIRGSLNSVADHLSRCINNITIALPDSKDLIKMQHEDPVLSPIIQKIDQNDVSPQVSNYFINGEEYGGHLTFFKTYHRLSENFFWQNMYKDTKNFVRSCTICLSRKNAFKILPAPHQPVEQIQEPGETCHIDIFGPLKTTPKVVDNATYFKSSEFVEFCRVMGIHKRHISNYSAHVNGRVEKPNQSLANILASISQNTNDWDEQLPHTMLALNSPIHEATYTSPFFLEHGRDIRLSYTYEKNSDTPQNKVQHVEQLRKRFNTHVNRMIPFIKRFPYLLLNKLDDLQLGETEVKGIVPSPRRNSLSFVIFSIVVLDIELINFFWFENAEDQECGCVGFNGPDGRQGCVLTRTVESNQGGRFDSNESVADSFPSGAVGFKSWSARICEDPLGSHFENENNLESYKSQ
ncbi:retrovirus-related Pol polyprotein from transposon 17.6 [Trichonephila clavipes]|nr:retrovirus-related Pol polyprotein from transposon 17.6 [Trichonephila clavipes]